MSDTDSGEQDRFRYLANRIINSVHSTQEAQEFVAEFDKQRALVAQMREALEACQELFNLEPADTIHFMPVAESKVNVALAASEATDNG